MLLGALGDARRTLPGAGGTGRPGRAAPVHAPALTPYYSQKPAWRACGVPGFQCATVKAPLDYDKPSAA